MSLLGTNAVKTSLVRGDNAGRLRSGASGYVCPRCSLRVQCVALGRLQQRWMMNASAARGRNDTVKSEGERLATGGMVRGMGGLGREDVLDVLEARGYIHQIAGTRETLSSLLSHKRIGAYVGVDPTAASMHVGHLIPFMSLFWLYLHGHRTITLVGSGTASIGDPSGRSTSRPHLSAEQRARNGKGIEGQLRTLWTNVGRLGDRHAQGVEEGERRKGVVLDNEVWLRGTSLLDVLGTIGVGLRLGVMLGRDTVKTRMTTPHSKPTDGMSFSEFCYPVLQAWDWWHMHQHHDVQVQIGGSDQYGNILSGVDGIKYALKSKDVDCEGDLDVLPVAFTVPLLTTASGEKFGKSAGNAIWLDKKLTSVFDLYGFFVGVPDSEVEKLLNFFTFLPRCTIQETVQRHLLAPEKRVAQHLLAREFVELVHGPEEAALAQDMHLNRSSSTTTTTSPSSSSASSSSSSSSSSSFQAPSPDLALQADEVLGKPFAFVLHAAGLAETRSKAVKLIESGGAYLLTREGKAVKIESGRVVRRHDLVGDGRLLLRAGKWKVRCVEVR